ncbi:MAG: peptide deformylase [Planctomycetaceae bacterium]|jgi:peptide deformylase|nr:peptide deformylase [Planctomycetaceae bacterium]MBT6155305.1 peptide deformylase [Planctomycetaceae bacterium]MBT6485199.1 peptide deformylase [Planctomycetaceae bacterium]MBT6497116.1 peptide deformylase [Planctomycetaceae bacterium]
MNIVNYPHPALRWKSKPIAEINAKLRETVREMFNLMYEARGIGLAANQVGLPFRLFIVNATAEPEETEQELVFINPEITQRKGSIEGEEGCLSLPELYGQVRRAEEIVVEAFDLQGREFSMTLTELAGRVVQHETDHLDGVMFTDRLSESAQREVEGRLDDFESQFRRQQADGEIPSDDEIKRQLKATEPK